MNPPPFAFHPWLGVFETLRVEDGRAWFAEEHWRCLRAGCAALGLRCAEDFRRRAGELPAGATGRWRWIVDEGGARHVFQPEKFPPRPRGLSLALATGRVGSRNLDARFKTLSYLTHWQARRENPRGEALLLNEHGEIASGAMTNVFWARGGELFTPAEDCGCRAGVVRGWVLREHGAVRRVRAPAGELDGAGEAFLTNSLLGICPVTRWQGWPLPVGPLTRHLRRRYRLACERQTA